MVWGDFKVGKQKWFSGGTVASAVRLDGDKDGVNLSQCFSIVGLHDPAFLGGIVLIEDSELGSEVPVGPSLSPGFVGAGLLHARVLVQIVSVKDQRLSFGEENASGGFPSVSVVLHVIDFG